MINTCQGCGSECSVHISTKKLLGWTSGSCLVPFAHLLGLFPTLSPPSSEFDRSWAKTNCPIASRRNSGIRPSLCYSSYCFICLESDRGLPEGTCRTSADTKRLTEATCYMPHWWRHHHKAMQRERWIPRLQAPSCFKEFKLLQWRTEEALMDYS